MHDLQYWAHELLAATLNPLLPSVNLPKINDGEAYQIQNLMLAEQGLQVTDIRCWKIGSQADGKRSICAPIYPHSHWQTEDTLKRESFRTLKIELELGFTSKQVITLSDTADLTNNWQQYFNPPQVCFELVDCRLTQEAQLNPSARLADNQLTKGVVVGNVLQQPIASDLPHQLLLDKQLNYRARGGHPMGGSIKTLAQALPTLVQRIGTLPKDRLILTGAWRGMIEVGHAREISAGFDSNRDVAFYLRNLTS